MKRHDFLQKLLIVSPSKTESLLSKLMNSVMLQRVQSHIKERQVCHFLSIWEIVQLRLIIWNYTIQIFFKSLLLYFSIEKQTPYFSSSLCSTQGRPQCYFTVSSRWQPEMFLIKNDPLAGVAERSAEPRLTIDQR